jgi:hypothetical protein
MPGRVLYFKPHHQMKTKIGHFAKWQTLAFIDDQLSEILEEAESLRGLWWWWVNGHAKSN